MKAFHNDPKLKAELVRLVRLHRNQDQLEHGFYTNELSGDAFRGCAVGCSINSLNRIKGKTWNPADHAAFEEAAGVPEVLARLQDGIFERLPRDEAQLWPEKFWQAIPVGADLSMIWPKFALWLLADKKHGVIRSAETDAQKKAIADVADLYRRWVDGKKPSRAEWKKAATAATATAATAAATAAAAATATAATTAATAAATATATAAAYAYASAAYAAADAYAQATAAAAAAAYARSAQAKKLLALMKAA